MEACQQILSIYIKHYLTKSSYFRSNNFANGSIFLILQNKIPHRKNWSTKFSLTFIDFRKDLEFLNFSIKRFELKLFIELFSSIRDLK